MVENAGFFQAQQRGVGTLRSDSVTGSHGLAINDRVLGQISDDSSRHRLSPGVDPVAQLTEQTPGSARMSAIQSTDSMTLKAKNSSHESISPDW